MVAGRFDPTTGRMEVRRAPHYDLLGHELREAWARVRESLRLDLDPQMSLLMVAWRLTRTLGYRQGRLDFTSRLSEEFSPADFDMPQLALPHPDESYKRRVWEEIRSLGPNAYKDPWKWPLRILLTIDDGQPLRPPVANEAPEDPGVEPATRWRAAMYKLADELHLAEDGGTNTYVQLGRAVAKTGIWFDPRPRDIWPTPLDIMEFEVELLEAVSEQYLNRGSQYAERNLLMDQFGMSRVEAKGISFAAVNYTLSAAHDLDPEVQKRALNHQLNEFVMASREAGDLSNQRQGLASLMRLHGLGTATGAAQGGAGELTEALTQGILSVTQRRALPE